MSVSRSHVRFRIPSQIIWPVLIILSLLIPHRANAQVEKGVITGTIKEGTGAVLQGAEVTLQNASTGLSTLTSTNSEGIYVSPPLSPGEYVVKIAAPGFDGSIHHVRLAVGQRLSVDATLTVGCRISHRGAQ